ncbi:MAG: saccharopine dehydrogenase C-terminal domain-containing protein [Ferruginibacter sp.]
MNIGVLGAGMVGRAIAEDLAGKYNVYSYDFSKENLCLLKIASIKKCSADLQSYDQYSNLFSHIDMFVLAVPGFMGFETLKQLMGMKKNIIDISFFPEDSLTLEALAKENNITVITDCGVAPGMSNFLLGYWNEHMQVEKFLCYVGGLPKLRVLPFEYKAPFSPIDVLEEYQRPARYVENGHIVTREALSDIENIDFPFAGTLEAFNTDGLRSLMFTMPGIPDMKEKTLRYPGHASLIKSLIRAGYFSTEKIVLNGTQVSPLEVSQALLFRQWQLTDEDEEFTLMQIDIEGIQQGKSKKISYLLYDERDKVTRTSSMSRTTGYACTAHVNLVAENIFSEKGIFPPEKVGKHEACYNYVMQYLEDRNIHYRMTENET